VGFIQNLPHKLVAAFKSTLDELHYADLLLHIIDISNDDWRNHVDVVNELLGELGLGDKQILHVFNKMDVVDPLVLAAMDLSDFEPHVLTNAESSTGLDSLKEAIKVFVNSS
jgi:GTP-binding protein HflX